VVESLKSRQSAR